ncbi:MAG TPA: hypothetical protein VM537_01680, partial [Anaerolineae bacterium]|nr:hypothetical protein [Anaerolineae bacterium]
MRIHWRPRALWHRIVVTADVSSGRAMSGLTRFPVSVVVAIASFAASGLALGACSPSATPALSPPATEAPSIAAAAATP